MGDQAKGVAKMTMKNICCFSFACTCAYLCPLSQGGWVQSELIPVTSLSFRCPEMASRRIVSCDFGCADRPPDLVSYRGTCCLPSKEDGGANDLQSPAPTTVSMILMQWDCQWTWGWLSSSSLCCWHLELLKICTFLPTGLSIISHVWFLTQTLFRLSFFSEKWLQSSRSLVLSILF